MSTEDQHQREPKNRQKFSASSTLFIIPIVLLVAAIAATLFTAWTPGGNSESAVQEQQVVQIQAPTVTPTTGSAATPSSDPLVGIVSGHWGNDSGAVCADGLTEAEVNQNIATLVQNYLIDAGYEVDLLREFDPILDGYTASALVSIHADSCSFINDQATGFKVATALARSNRESSTYLAACLRSRYAQITELPMHTTSLTSDMTSYHAFNEIADETPAAIIETGFLNLDRQFLTEQPELAAQGIAAGILCFLNNEPITPTLPP
jgi:N-acetylmuramoyl-L-alanine amidase